MNAKDWREQRVTKDECADVSRKHAHEGRIGRFELATILVALNAPIILLALCFKLGFITSLGLLALAFIFYVALMLSIYIFHKPARWAFIGIVDSFILAYIVHWIH